MHRLAILILALLLATLTGCASVGWTADQIGRGVSSYCDRTSSLEREVIRARANLKAHPHEIRVECKD